jgi:hypothetical protein
VSLRVAKSLTLPVDVAGEAIAILAKRGAGKTNTATVLVEELYAADVQVVVLDPVGVWWGLRSSADGEKAGLKVAVIGGTHGDVPLEETAGKLLADVAVDSGQSLVIDLSDFPSKASMQRFVVDFAQRLYQRKGREQSVLHLVLEEADVFAPQSRTMRGQAGEQHAAIEQIVRRGRSRGLGVTLITQRSAVLNKDVLTQTDVLIVLRTTGPQDIKAIGEWVNAKGDERGQELLDSLPGLATGEAWIWNPEHDVLARAQIRARRTFDSSRTPKAGERRVEPRKIAEIDPAQLGEQIAATAEKAKENDPKHLQHKIRELQRELKKRPTETQVETVTERVEVQVPVFNGEVDQLADAVGDLRTASASIASAAEAISQAVAAAQQLAKPPAREQGERREMARRPRTEGVAPARRPAPTSVDEPVKAGARRIVETLARHYPLRVTKAQLGTLTGFKITGGTFQTYFSQLKRLGLIEDVAGEISVTQGGLDFAGVVPAEPMTTDELLDMWRRSLKAGARNMLDQLVARHPDSVTKEELADLVEMTVTGGTFQTYLGTLRRNGLIDVDAGYVRASDTLFIAESV